MFTWLAAARSAVSLFPTKKLHFDHLFTFE
jgi:hypothetical protein